MKTLVTTAAIGLAIVGSAGAQTATSFSSASVGDLPTGLGNGISATVRSQNGVPPVSSQTVTKNGKSVHVFTSSTPGGSASATASASSGPRSYP